MEVVCWKHIIVEVRVLRDVADFKLQQGIYDFVDILIRPDQNGLN